MGSWGRRDSLRPRSVASSPKWESLRPRRCGSRAALFGGLLLDHEGVVLLLVDVAHLLEDALERIRKLLVAHLEGDLLLRVDAVLEDERRAVREVLEGRSELLVLGAAEGHLLGELGLELGGRLGAHP